jgi:hypothetical protein
MMGDLERLRQRADECLQKAQEVGNRQRARVLMLQAHDLLKVAEETEARRLHARS